MDGGVPLENTTGETENNSDYLDFGFYDRTEPSELWIVGLDQAAATLKSATQKIVISAVLPLCRR